MNTSDGEHAVVRLSDFRGLNKPVESKQKPKRGKAIFYTHIQPDHDFHGVRLHITAFDSDETNTRPLGTMLLTKAQWEELKVAGDTAFAKGAPSA